MARRRSRVGLRVQGKSRSNAGANIAYTNQIAANVLTVAGYTASEINVGDFLYLASGTARPFSVLPDAGSLALNQAGARDYFLGVAQTRKAAGEAGNILVATAGRVRIVCNSEVHEIGDLMGASYPVASWPLSNVKLRKVAVTAASIARCCEATPATTEITVEIFSTIMQGGMLPA